MSRRPELDVDDSLSAKGQFEWKTIGAHLIPCLFRIINGECIEFVSTRIAESQLLRKVHYFYADIYKCTSVKSHFITEIEAKLLNEINDVHCEKSYGKKPFIAGKDYIVRFDDVQEFYKFIEVCYKRLKSNFTPGGREKFGFIRFNSQSIVPYCTKNENKYLPHFFFEGISDILSHRTIKLENWDLAYMKFCCKIQGINEKWFAGDSCIVSSLSDITNYFSLESSFQETWPIEKDAFKKILTNQESNHVNPPGCWIKKPSTILNDVTVPENIAQHPLSSASQSAMAGSSYAMGMSSNLNASSSNQMNLAVSQQNRSRNPMNIQPSPLVQTSIPLIPIENYNPNIISPMGQSTTTTHSSNDDDSSASFSIMLQ